jgi:hypothetical protein
MKDIEWVLVDPRTDMTSTQPVPTPKIWSLEFVEKKKQQQVPPILSCYNIILYGSTPLLNVKCNMTSFGEFCKTKG